MTTGEWLASLSTAEDGSDMLTVVANIEGTYPVLAPVESFNVDLTSDLFTADLDIISTTVNLEMDLYNVDITEDVFSADFTMESYNVNTNTNQNKG